MNEHYVINLGRQLGSGGKEIGEKLAQEFGIAFYDKELIKLASEESGLCKEFFEKADEKASQSIIGGLFGTRFPFISDGAIPYGSCLSNDALFKIQSDVIRELAEKQSCLFVGRCADYILRDHPRCVNIFVSCLLYTSFLLFLFSILFRNCLNGLSQFFLQIFIEGSMLCFYIGSQEQETDTQSKTAQNSPTNEAQIQQEHLHLTTGHHRHTFLYGSIVL